MYTYLESRVLKNRNTILYKYMLIYIYILIHKFIFSL